MSIVRIAEMANHARITVLFVAAIAVIYGVWLPLEIMGVLS